MLKQESCNYWAMVSSSQTSWSLLVGKSHDVPLCSNYISISYIIIPLNELGFPSHESIFTPIPILIPLSAHCAQVFWFAKALLQALLGRLQINTAIYVAW